jgi:transposase
MPKDVKWRRIGDERRGLRCGWAVRAACGQASHATSRTTGSVALPRRRTEHGSGLGRVRWVVERTFAWLHYFRRLRIRWERDAALHYAFVSLGCSLICWRHIRP